MWVFTIACNEVFFTPKRFSKNVDSGNSMGESVALKLGVLNKIICILHKKIRSNTKKQHLVKLGQNHFTLTTVFEKKINAFCWSKEG